MHKIIGSLTPATAGVPQTETLPESETPEVDAVRIDDLGRTIIWTGVAENKLLDLARSLERRLSLAQTEIKGHVRVEDELRAELAAHKTVIGLLFESLPNCPFMGDLPGYVDEMKARVAELEKDAARYRWLRDNAETINGEKINWHCQDEYRPHPPMQSLDAAIDAALKDRA